MLSSARRPLSSSHSTKAPSPAASASTSCSSPRALSCRIRYGYAIVAGVRKAPLKVSKTMSAKKVSFPPLRSQRCHIAAAAPPLSPCASSYIFLSDRKAQQGEAFSEAGQLCPRHAHTVRRPCLHSIAPLFVHQMTRCVAGTTWTLPCCSRTGEQSYFTF